MDDSPLSIASPRHPLQIERYTFEVGGKRYGLQFMPMLFVEGYDDAQLARLAQSAVYDVSFALKEFVRNDGTVIEGYGATGTGDAFRVLGGVAQAILAWAQERRPDYLLWHAHGIRRQRLYDRMIRYFAARGDRVRRLEADPFTTLSCSSEIFWLVC